MTGRQEVRRKVCHRLREAIARMRRSDDIRCVLSALKEGLRELEIPFQDCGINLVDPHRDPAVVSINNLGRYGEWKEPDQAWGKDLVFQFWEGGVPMYRRDLRVEDVYCERKGYLEYFGHPVLCVLDIPFAYGTLAVNSEAPNAFSEADIASLQEVAEALTEGFRRLDDLKNLATKEEQLQQSQKMEAVGQLAGGVAHDFNNLITVITGYCQLLLKTLAPDSMPRQNVQEIMHAGDRAAVMVRQLLTFSRRQVAELQVIDLGEVIADMDKMLRRMIGEDVVLITTPGSELDKVEADPGQLEQVIMNLAVNFSNTRSRRISAK